jgi:DcuC family C4-dicarboxylate transporter
MGGELFNPGAVEIAKLASLTKLSAVDVIEGSRALNFLSCAVVLLSFWLISALRARAGVAPPGSVASAIEESAAPIEPKLNVAKAIIPLLPIILLVVDSMAGSYSVERFLPGPSRILAAMILGVAAAGLSSRGNAAGLATAFFDGAGYGYTHVISLIVVASTFAAGVELSGLIGLLLKGMSAWPSSALVAAPVASCFLAVVAGSGIAPAVAIMDFFVPAAGSMGLDAIDLGAATSLGAHFGRTMSPAAAVVAMAARLSGANPRELIRQVAVPLLLGLTVLVAAALIRNANRENKGGNAMLPARQTPISFRASFIPGAGKPYSLAVTRARPARWFQRNAGRATANSSLTVR